MDAIVPTRITLGEVIATVAVAPSAWEDVETVAVAVLQGSVPSERLSEITSRRSAKGCAAATDSLSPEAMAVEDSGPAKAEEQD